jgi:myo-inositol catabolism protein IolH
MKFAEQTFKVGGEPIVASSLFGYPEKMKYQAVETRELIERELLRR